MYYDHPSLFSTKYGLLDTIGYKQVIYNYKKTILNYNSYKPQMVFKNRLNYLSNTFVLYGSFLVRVPTLGTYVVFDKDIRNGLLTRQFLRRVIRNL